MPRILLARGGEGTATTWLIASANRPPCRDDQASHATRAANMPVSGRQCIADEAGVPWPHEEQR